MNELEKNADHVQSHLESNELQATRPLRDMAGIEVNVYFRTGSVELEASEREKIFNVVRAMWVYPMMNASLGGLADSRGSAGYKGD